MDQVLARRTVLAGLPIAAWTAGSAWAYGRTETAPTAGGGSLPAHFPSQDPALVQKVVGLSHRDLDGVRALVERQPALAKAAWDWGFGDWETALGAASHTGRREIALLLIEHGARPDIFTFAMLGNLPAVRAMIEGSPGVQRIAGPHGISLLNHAVAGGGEAEPVLEYLRGLGDADPQPVNLPLEEAGRKVFHGTFRVGPGEDELVVIDEAKGLLSVTRQGQPFRNLLYQGENAFAPVGAPAVRVRFILENNAAVRIEFHDPDLYLTGVRVEG